MSLPTATATATAACTFGDSPASVSGTAPEYGPLQVGSIIDQLNKLSFNSNAHAKKVPVAVYSPPHLRSGDGNGADFGIDDPFNSPPGRATATPSSPKKKSKANASKNWRSSSDGSSDFSPSAGRGSGQRRLDNDLELIGQDSASANIHSATRQPERAQEFYPPSACVFAANLPACRTDVDVEAAVTRLFSQYGVVFVKLRRDPNNNPFAFCQYTNDAEAHIALDACQGKNILGRPVRTEMAKAQREYAFEREFGTPIRREEARQVLGCFGEIKSVRFPSHAEKSEHRLVDAVIVEFAMYDQGQDALKVYRNHEVYRMKSLANSSRRTPNRPNPASRAFLANYELDRRSIFAGGLPTEIEEAELMELFSSCGKVVHVMVHKPESIIDASQKHCFAFVEFAHHEMAIRAVAELNNVVLRGKTLKITRKDTEGAKSRSSTRRQTIRFSPTAATYSTPAPIRPRVQQQISSPVYVAPRARATPQVAPVPYVSPATYATPTSTFSSSPPTGASGCGVSYSTPSPPTFAAPVNVPQSGYDANQHWHQLYQYNSYLSANGQYHLMVDTNGRYLNPSPPWSAQTGHANTGYANSGSPPQSQTWYPSPVAQTQPQYWQQAPPQQQFSGYQAAPVQPGYYAQQSYAAYSVAPSSEYPAASNSEEQHLASPTSIGHAEVGQTP